MTNLHLVPQKESAVKSELESSLKHVRAKHYDLPRDYGGFVAEFVQSFYQEFIEGFVKGFKHTVAGGDIATAISKAYETPLLAGLKEAVEAEGLQNGSIADFCCGSGKKTLAIARAFPNADVYGFDVLPHSIKKAKKRGKGVTNVHFSKADVYDFKDDRRFDAVTFNRACGTLADKVIQYGTEREVPVIAGKFCCYHTIPDETPPSKNLATGICLKFMGKVNDFVRNRVAKNYVSPAADIDKDLLSEFAGRELGVSEAELQTIAGTAVDAKIGSRIIDLNRVMKLIERNYNVGYDEGNHIVVARRKKN